MRLALRSLRRHPGLVLTIVSMLTLALAFTIAGLSILNGLLVHPYPYPNLSRLLLVRDSKPREGAHQGRAIAVGDFLDARDRTPAFSQLAAWRPQPLVITSANSDPERVEGAAVTANFFAVLGITPTLGRGLLPDEDVAGRDDVVLLSRRLWNSRFGADPSLMGRAIELNGRSASVVGIVRDEDCYPSGIDVWIPLVFTPAEATDRSTQRIAAIGRLKEGVTEHEAAAQLASVAHELGQRFPTTNRGRGFDVLPLRREQYEFTAPLFLFVQAAALLVLLIAALNVNTLLVARTLDRSRELAVRSMLGASVGRVVGVAVAEVLVLTTTAAVLSALFAAGLLRAIQVSLPEGIARWIAGWSSLRVDLVSVAAGGAVWLLTTVAIGASVALTGARAAREGSATVRVTRRTSLSRRLLMASQVALVAALLLGASVMVVGFGRIAAAFASLSPSELLRFTLTLPESRYPSASRVASFHEEMLDAIGALPEVERVALIRNEPASNVPNPIEPFQREDAPILQMADVPKTDVEVVSPAAFETLRLGLIAGRPILDSDGANQPRVAVISRTAALRFWRDRDPVGMLIRLGTEPQPVRIVGVVGDFRLNWYDPEMRPVVYLPDRQAPARTTSVIVRTRTDPMVIARRVRAVVARLDARQPLSDVEPLSAAITDSLSPVRIIERVLLAAAALSALLAAAGIYGVLAHWAGSRRRELGVRFAFGASPGSIAWLVLREALVTAGAGGATGLVLAIIGLRLAGAALLGVPSLDARVLVFVAASIFALTLGASLHPARRAARVDVAELLRLE